MKILLWHGYLLSGSGSNVYTANLVRSWQRHGHDVLLLCQERHPEPFADITAAGDFSDDNASFHLSAVNGGSSGSGRIRLLRPNLGGLLPVYVYDDYEGFTVKTFVDLSESELRDYTERNVTAMKRALDWFEPEIVITGHEVMGPYIARQATTSFGHSYLAKLHGSGLEYAVKAQPRYAEFASLGLEAAKVVVGGSHYMIEEASSAIPGNFRSTAVVNPGCDIDLFGPQEKVLSRGRVGFVGKLIAAKGVHHLLAALPLMAHVKEALIVGYGGFEVGLRELTRVLGRGDVEGARAVAAAGEGRPLDDLVSFLRHLPAGYEEASARVEPEFTGRLEHDALSGLLPTLDVLAVPSVVPEAFGMVVAEAAACGVLSVAPDHSGIGEAVRAIEEAIARPGLLTYDAADPIHGLAQAVDRVLALPLGERGALEEEAIRLARERWSWDEVARRLVQLAAG